MTPRRKWTIALALLFWAVSDLADAGIASTVWLATAVLLIGLGDR